MTAPRRRPLFTSVRARFAAAYAGLLAGTGAALLILFYSYLRLVPGYSTSAAPPASVGDENPVPPGPIADGPTLLGNLVLGGLALAVVVTAMWIGWLIAGRLLRPLATINEAAIRVAQGDFDHRVRLTGPDDEFANLAHTFDSMLDRIQHSLDAHRRFAANASHELLTPLATNKTMLDVALRDPASTDTIELLRRLQRTNQHSIEAVDALLDLAEINQGQIEKEAVDLRDLAEVVLEDTRAEAAKQSIVVNAQLDPATSMGNATLLSRLISNLLHNAIRHNVPGGSVTVTTGHDDSHAWIEVDNTGPVMTTETALSLTEPFVRVLGRTIDADSVGRGLGLTIVQSIVHAHHGSLVLAPRTGGGLVATVGLPSQGDLP